MTAVFVGRVVGLRDVITFEGKSYAEVEQAFRDSIDDYLAFCAERRESPDPTLQRQNTAAPQSGGSSKSGTARRSGGR